MGSTNSYQLSAVVKLHGAHVVEAFRVVSQLKRLRRYSFIGWDLAYSRSLAAQCVKNALVISSCKFIIRLRCDFHVIINKKTKTKTKK